MAKIVPFKQLIKPGDHGRDVLAVKDGMVRMHVNGSGGLGKTKFAGKQFVVCIKKVQRHHGQLVDGIYGKDTHKIIAPFFSAYDRWRYRTTTVRKAVPAGPPHGDAQSNAKKLMEFYKEGKYHADNGPELQQIELTAQGKGIWSPMGRLIHIDPKVMKVLVWLIEDGFTIGTFAMCSDHPYDSPLGHAGGHAVDISSINGVSIAAGSAAARDNTRKVAERLSRHAPSELKPWQLICDGYGYIHDSQISACTIPNASFYGYTTMSEHRNHIHVGYR